MGINKNDIYLKSSNNSIFDFYTKINNTRNNLDYDIDGLVAN